MSSCLTGKYYNVTNCSLEMQKTISRLKEQKVPTKDIAINHSIFSEDSECNNTFEISVGKWKGIKTEFTVVSIPMLKINDEIFINAYYISGDLRDEFDEQFVINEINYILANFKKENKNLFDEKTIEKIEEYF